MSDLVHLHNHSFYSLMDGLNSPAELLDAAKALGHNAMAFTDHGTLSVHREAQQAAKDAGMKPILGLEAYISATDRFDRKSMVAAKADNTSLYNHVVLLARDKKGLKNLQSLSEIAWTEGYYYKPRIDRESLAHFGEGIIVLSGCMSGLVAKAIERERYDEAEFWMTWFKDNHGDNFYVEVQPHNPVELNTKLLEYADMYNVKPVVTADCHFARPEDRWVEEAMLILSTSPARNKDASFEKSRSMEIFDRLRYLYPERPISFEEIDVYVMGRQTAKDAMVAQGITRDDIYDNTLAIADSVGDYDYFQGLDLLPAPKVDADAQLRKLCEAGLTKRGLLGIPAYDKRLNMELDIIERKGFAAYMLIEEDLVSYARKMEILIGPGRGSAAGSLIAFALGVTLVDPIKYKLLFARFINEERNDFPDIDTDVEDRRRKEVKDYAVKKFKNVASIATFNYFSEKGVVRDAARVYNVPLGEVNRVLKFVDTFEQYESGKEAAEFRRKYPEVLDLARRLRGRMRGSGLHAGGIVMSKKPISNYAPMETRKDPKSVTDERIPVVAYDMDQVADIGLIKYDVLGLKTLSVISDTVKSIKARHGISIDLEAIPLDDPNVLAMLSNGFTKGVFQCEAAPYTKLLKDIQVNGFEDVVASNALVRPGAMNTVGAKFIARQRGSETVEYVHPIMEEYTENTYGLIIYQEQVMQACVYLAGMSWAEADKIRKIIGKKKDVHEFDEYRTRFVEGASKHISVEAAENLWHDFEAHAGYSFNRSHAVAYSMLSMWTGWLKHYYPIEFMCAVLNNEGDKDAMTEYLIETKRLGIKVLLPHVNESGVDHKIVGDSIRMGLADIKYLSAKTAPRLLAHAPFGSYAELLAISEKKGSGINSRMVGALNKIGAAAFPDNPKTGRERENFYEYLRIPAFDLSDIPESIHDQVNKCDEFEEKGVFIILGMVTEIKRGVGKGWSRVSMVDSSGTIGVFHNENTQIEAGQMYAFLIGDNRIHRYVPIDELKSRGSDPFVEFLYADALDVPADSYYVVDFTPYKTKAGKMMGHIILAKADKEMKRVMLFNKNYGRALAKMKSGATCKVALNRLDDDTLFVKEIY